MNIKNDNSIIEVKDLEKSYGSLNAVKKISFSVEKGSFFAFLGENGAGKSTTINILCTILSKNSGTVKIDNLDLDTNELEIKKRIGIVFQNSVLDFELTVYENLFLRGTLYNLTKEELKDRINFLNEKLDLKDIMKRRYSTLSGGQKRRVDIARALINKPKILFLDEPTVGLDPQTRIKVWNIINELRNNEELTVFLTTHYMEETIACDKVVIIDNGNIICEGTPHELIKQYSYDHIIWHTDKTKENDLIIENASLTYKYNTAYVIKVKNSIEATKFIINNKDILLDYEVIKGSMDDVFLNVTGKKLGDK